MSLPTLKIKKPFGGVVRRACKGLAASLGLEPRQTEPESVVLPLHHEAPWLPDQDSNPDKLNQNQWCYHYTIGQLKKHLVKISCAPQKSNQTMLFFTDKVETKTKCNSLSNPAIPSCVTQTRTGIRKTAERDRWPRRLHRPQQSKGRYYKYG